VGDAAAAGVTAPQRPGRRRARVFERIPLAPDVCDSTLGRVADGVRCAPRIVVCHGRLGGLFVPPGASAWTLGSTVLVRAGRETDSTLIAHEVVHVAQWRELGVVGFLAAYLRAYFRERLRGCNHWEAYRRVPAEVEAFAVDAEFACATGRDDGASHPT
jgi:hypothetical protein